MLGGSKPPEALGDYTGFLMSWCAARSRGAFGRALEELGLRPPQFAVLSVIDTQPGLTQQALVEATGIDPSSMVQLLDALSEAGLAERRPHPTDRRKRAVHLTDQGRDALRRARGAATEVGEATFAPLAPEERRQLHALLRKLSGLDAG
jgi:MarR family transcriptional regulator, lower aerobic nicotinate degradation pathway regulator